MMETTSPAKIRILTNKETRVYELLLCDETSAISSEDLEKDEFMRKVTSSFTELLEEDKPHVE